MGGEREASAGLGAERNGARNLPVRDWRPRSSTDVSRVSWAAVGADLLGCDGIAEGVRRASASIDAAKLDGLLAVWHPGLEK